MILSISSSLATFKSVRFREGLNVLLADTHIGASAKQTRNSAGKTSLIEILHFLLGADCKPNSLFRTDVLAEQSFRGSFEFSGRMLSVERTGSNPSRIYLLSDLENWDAAPTKDEARTGRPYISNREWRALLGHVVFGMPLDVSGTIFAESYTPSFRAMISYFARRQAAGAFRIPEKQAEQQQKWDWQQNLSYLFGLDWQIAFEFNKVRMREKSIEALKRAAREGALGDVVGSVADLRSEVSVAERKAQQRRAQLREFRVLESYSELADRAAAAKTQMQKLARRAVGLRERLGHLEQAFSEETPPDARLLTLMYESVGIELPGLTVRRLEDVTRFYESVIVNRMRHLNAEIDTTRARLKENESKSKELDSERRRILKILESHGALEDFVSLQRELADLEANASALRERFKTAEILEGEKTQLEIDRSNLHQRLQHDFQERKETLDAAITAVTGLIEELYDDRIGNFAIDATERGPEFGVSIEGDRGSGIANMEIFCLDVALLTINASRGHEPGFLVHDSHLFDGVDERQIARALALGGAAARDKRAQYIVTMNSDVFDRLPLDDSIDIDEVVLQTRLSDESETGGLFGFRFG